MKSICPHRGSKFSVKFSALILKIMHKQATSIHPKLVARALLRNEKNYGYRFQAKETHSMLIALSDIQVHIYISENYVAEGGTHMLKPTGMCHLNGLLFHQKSLDMGPILV